MVMPERTSRVVAKNTAQDRMQSLELSRPKIYNGRDNLIEYRHDLSTTL